MTFSYKYDLFSTTCVSMLTECLDKSRQMWSMCLELEWKAIVVNCQNINKAVNLL